MARAYCVDKVVLDLGCGAGYGGGMLKDAGAAMVVGVDISFEAASFAKNEAAGLHVAVSSVTEIPLRDASIDVVVSFEVIEHIHSPELLVREARRVLRSEGVFIVSTPNRSVYNESRSEPNPFHVSEMEVDEFRRVLSQYFPFVEMSAQKVVLASVVWDVEDRNVTPTISSDVQLPEAPYVVAVCSNEPLQKVDSSAFSSWRVMEELDDQVRHLEELDAREVAARTHIAAIESAMSDVVKALADADQREIMAREQLRQYESEIERLRTVIGGSEER